MSKTAPANWVRFWIATVSVVLVLFVTKARAADPEPVKFEEETLPNGLRVIYSPLHQAPVVHVRVMYHVGSRDERLIGRALLTCSST